jgi:microcystin-dependent protein
VELADNTETQAGVSSTRAVTPASLASRTANTDRAGIIQIASASEIQDGKDMTKAVTPEGITWLIANNTRAGIVRLATNTETQGGTDMSLAVTPASLTSRTATETRSGLVQLASSSETQTGTNTSKAVTPAGLASRTASETRAGIVELADNTETQAGIDATRAVTPAGLASAASLFVPPGAVMPFASAATPSGWLAANGNVVPNGIGTVQGITANFAALFAVVGTTYGAAGTLPDLRGYFVRGSGTNSDTTASGTFGTKQADAFQGHRHSTTAQRYTEGPNTYQASQDYGDGADHPAASVGDPSTDGTNGTPRTASETRPRNIALLYCIKI